MQHRASTGSRLLALLRGTVLLGPLLGGTAYGIEQPAYQVLEEDGDFSIRRYAPYLVAETRVQGDFDEAGDAGASTGCSATSPATTGRPPGSA